jgi:putative SOS response-associated peptidase YedK
MCGRFRLSRHKEILAEYFGMDFDALKWHPRYNIAPTQQIPVITQDGDFKRVSLMRWGLVPSWAADLSGGARMINARSETAAAKPSFREALQTRRCLIPADAFYEWQRSTSAKQPFCIEVGDAEIFAFAGLWDSWLGPDGKAVETCTILTTTANEAIADVHDRMPVILPREKFESWLDSRMQDAEKAAKMLVPFDATRVNRYPVSTRVNQVANDGPECSAPAPLAPVTLSLFD